MDKNKIALSISLLLSTCAIVPPLLPKPALAVEADRYCAKGAPPGFVPCDAGLITATATVSTAAATAVLAGATLATTWICGFDVSGIGTGQVGPVTVGPLVGGQTFTYQFSIVAASAILSRTFNPCIPANAVNTGISIVTTADGSATAVDVNAWGYQH